MWDGAIVIGSVSKTKIRHNFEGFNDWGGRGHDDFIPEEVIKTAPSGDETT